MCAKVIAYNGCDVSLRDSTVQSARSVMQCLCAETRCPDLPVSADMYEAALGEISEHIVAAGNTLSDYKLPQPPAAGF